jgi:hypothetical protein
MNKSKTLHPGKRGIVVERDKRGAPYILGKMKVNQMFKFISIFINRYHIF